MNLTFCNTTAEDMNISEIPIAGPFTFHDLALMISATTALLAMFTSFYLIWMHALNYTKPEEQKYIIRILLMVPIYAASSFLQLRYYHSAVYYSVISDCYEAFAISSFFGLLCQYTAPDLHQQKQFFRQLQPIKPWVWPITWFKKCCGGERGPWRTPKSGLTWFNIIWIGIYHYCFVRVAMTITAVLTQKFDRYCESSNSPYFAHIWCTAIDSVAVTIAMYCVIQFYFQLKNELSAHRPFLKVVAIKGVIFLSFWQSSAISVATSEFNIISASAKLSYPDISVGLPSLLLCIEMLLFAILHIWAYPWQPYRPDAPAIFYPLPTKDSTMPLQENVHILPSGGALGGKALWDALNLWDVIKAFVRGMRWLLVGAKKRHEDISYRKDADINMDGKDAAHPLNPYGSQTGGRSTDHLPIATQFRRSTFGMNQHTGGREPISPVPEEHEEEGAGLIAHAQDNPSSREPSPFDPYDRYLEDQPYESDLGYRGAAGQFRQEPQPYASQTMAYQDQPEHQHVPAVGNALSTDDYYQASSPTREDRSSTHLAANPSGYRAPSSIYEQTASQGPDTTQQAVGAALWGANPHQHRDGL
ncbi:hypothetical protein VP1G_02525 [Cytospora mali]|uniref:Transmembrane protein 184C n=1 Tax=Cytospora mali TaxID=578113 RepID=A0A194UU25_CYTMA|nr:hypothetical protein VP1G_02525 [Valsa mali var. pyri (nom. inval.)]